MVAFAGRRATRPTRAGLRWVRGPAGPFDTTEGCRPAYFGGGIDHRLSGSPDWTRTSNLPVNSRTLCRLSYGGSRGGPRLPAAPTASKVSAFRRCSFPRLARFVRGMSYGDSAEEMIMKYRAVFLAGAAAGYVLGTRAGRERYEQIVRLSRKIAENPRVQETAGVLREQAGSLADAAREKLSDKVQAVGGRVQERVPGLQRHEVQGEEPSRKSPRPGGTPADIS